MTFRGGLRLLAGKITVLKGFGGTLDGGLRPTTFPGGGQ